MSKTDPRWHLLALFLVCGVGGLWPYLSTLGHYPEGSDAVKWATNAAPVSPDWLEWVFGSRHFIGYRPATALTFTLNYVLTGWSPWGYRLTHIALHVATGIAVYGAFRVLFRDRGWWGVVAAAIFFVHPASETVVPHLARRSYLLGSLFSVLAVLAWTVVSRRTRPPVLGVLGACSALSVALLSNEIAYVVVPILILLSVLYRDPDRGLLSMSARALPILGVASLWIGVRYLVLGHMGGYHKRYLAYTRNNHNMILEVEDTPHQVFFEAAWRYLCFPTGASGEQALLMAGTWGLFLAVMVAGFYTWQALIAPLLPRADAERRLLLLILLWIFGHALLYALTRNWFWRQSYPMLAPFALLVTGVARETWRAHRSALRTVALALPQGLLIASLLYHSPVLYGVNEKALKGQIKASRIVHEITDHLSEQNLEDPSTIYLAMPVRGPAIREALLFASDFSCGALLRPFSCGYS